MYMYIHLDTITNLMYIHLDTKELLIETWDRNTDIFITVPLMW